MQVLEQSKKRAVCPVFQEESPHTLTLMDLFTALCEETDDDALVAAAVIHLFHSGYVKFQNN